MDTPEAPDRVAVPVLYGDGKLSINRRAMIGGAVALAATPAAAFVAGDPVERAMAAMGGRALLEDVRALSWTGTAKLYAGKTAQDFGVEVRIEPFVRARVNNWLLSEGRSMMRTLMIERDGGFEVVNGAQTPLPPERAVHERAQYGAYAYLLLVGAGVSASGARKLIATHPGYPDIMLLLAPDGRVAAADYTVEAADPGARAIRERFAFSGIVTANGLRWPRKIAISRDGRPYSALIIDDLSIETFRLLRPTP